MKLFTEPQKQRIPEQIQAMKIISRSNEAMIADIHDRGVLGESRIRRSLFSMVAAAFCIGGISTIFAAPIIDTFENLNRIENVLGSAILDNAAGLGPLTVTANETAPGVWGKYNGRAIFNWSTDGALQNGFSLNKADDQYLFRMTGAQAVGNAYPIDKIAFLFYNNGVYSGQAVISNIVPVNGFWELDVYQRAETFYGGNIPAGAVWAAQPYFVSILPQTANGAPGVGYSFESFAAIPEPNSVAFLLIGGLGGMMVIRRKVKRTAL